MSCVSSFEMALRRAWPPADWSAVTVIVAVSGGADSVALLRGLSSIRDPGPGRLVVAHLDHGLRDAAQSDRDFVVHLAEQLDLAVEVGVADVAGRANADGDGIEAAARAARYAFLQDVAERCGARFVLTGHTADDQAETILHRVLRGTGLAGLAGIPRARPLGPATLLRPLLELSRQGVIAYLTELRQPFCHDTTNFSCDYTRNRLRNELLPALRRDFNPEVDSALRSLGVLAGEAQQALQSMVQGLVDCAARHLSPEKTEIDIRPLQDCSPYLLRELLMEVWRQQAWPRQAMGRVQWERLAEMCHSPSSSTHDLPGPVRAKKAGEQLTLTRLL